MKRIKICFTVLCAVIVSMFTGVELVKADGDGTGYAQCYYTWKETISSYIVPDGSSVPGGANNTTYERPYKIGINFYKVGNSDNSYKSWADIGCGKSTGNSGNGPFTPTVTGLCAIDNYDHVFYNASKYSGYFKKKNDRSQITNHRTPTWDCPDNIYINKTNGNDRMSIYFSKDVCGALCSRTVPLAEDNSKQSGSPSKLNVKGYQTDRQKNETSAQSNGSTSDDIDYTGGESAVEGCDMLGDDFLDKLKMAFTVIQILGVVLLVGLSIFEFAQAITSSEQEPMKKAGKNTVKRVIAAVILLLLPVLIGFILNLMDLAGVNDIAGYCIEQFF